MTKKTTFSIKPNGAIEVTAEGFTDGQCLTRSQQLLKGLETSDVHSRMTIEVEDESEQEAGQGF